MPLPAFTDLLNQHPTCSKADVAKLIGGTVEQEITNHDFDTCSVRISRALNYTNALIPSGGGGILNPYIPDKKIHTYKGGDNKFYIFSTYDLRAFLTARYGQAKKFPGTATRTDLDGVKGIIAFNFFHFDLFDGNFCHYLQAGCFGVSKVTSGDILVWKAP
jgi:hypothetical protein